MNDGDIFTFLSDAIKSCGKAQINIKKDPNLAIVEISKAKGFIDIVFSEMKTKKRMFGK